MHTLSLSGVSLELSQDDIKLVLIALDSLHRSFRDESTRKNALMNIYKAEQFFNFEVDVNSLVTNPLKFLDASIGTVADIFYDAYFDLASSNGTLKATLEDNRITNQQLFDFLQMNLNAHSVGV